MSEKPTLDATRQQASGDARKAKRPYSPPAIEEEAIFESLAMDCDGANPKVCATLTGS
jgi:hypothetical protein